MTDNPSTDGRYKLSGYRYAGKEWRDVEAGAPLPRGHSWEKLDLVTVNLAPDTEEGFYRAAVLAPGGLDYVSGHPTYNYLNINDDFYTLDDLAYELALAYGFIAQ